MSSSVPPDPSMSPVSWRGLASSLKSYVSQKDYKGAYDTLSSRVRGSQQDGTTPTWNQWARQALKPGGVTSTNTLKTSVGVERLQLFPGWAVRRFKDPTRIHEDTSAFDLEVYVSGFASSLRGPEAATRSQRAFYRLAKGYAALPRLPAYNSERPDTAFLRVPSDLDLSKLPPRPSEINDDADVEALEAKFRQINDLEHLSASNRSDEALHNLVNSESSSVLDETHHKYLSNSTNASRSPSPTTSTSSLSESRYDHDIAKKLHDNLEQRLKPFWSSAIPNRLIRISIFCPISVDAPTTARDTLGAQEMDIEPLFVVNVHTNNQGSFAVKVIVPWERLTTHPQSLHIPFGDRNVEQPVVIQAEMWPPPPPVSTTPNASSSSIPYAPYQRRKAAHSSPDLLLSSSDKVQGPYDQTQETHARTTTRVTVSLPTPYIPVRVISDIDDTVKYAGVLSGAKKVFQNVFTKHLEDLVIPSMVIWYREMWQKGVRFHYVSNSPFELLPVLNEFFQVSTLPEGSIRLKSYAARALLPALLSPPAARKRDGVVEVLNAFPNSYFILIGDSGEQDLELYTELARERPQQIEGVFIRDVTTDPTCEGPLMTLAGDLACNVAEVLHGKPAERLIYTEPDRMPDMQVPSRVNPSDTPTPVSGDHNRPWNSATPTTPRMPQRSRSSTGLTPYEKRKFDLVNRIERARMDIPSHIAFRVFRDPDECVETRNILHRRMNFTYKADT